MTKRLHCPFCNEHLHRQDKTVYDGIYNFACPCSFKYKARYYLTVSNDVRQRQIEEYRVGKYLVIKAAKDRWTSILNEDESCFYQSKKIKTPYFKTEEVLETFVLLK